MLEPEGSRDVVEVGHAAHVDPGLRHGDGDIGEAEAELVDEHDLAIGVRNHFPHQILAGDAEMHGALGELRGDLGRGQISDFRAVEAGNGAAILARTAGLDEFKPRTCEKVFGVLLQASLGRYREDERRAHAGPPQAASSSTEAAKPTAGNRFTRAQSRQEFIVAAASNQRTLGVGIVQFEDEAGVVIETAAERGGEMYGADVDALGGKKAGAGLEQIDRGPKREVGVGGECAQFCGCLVWNAAHRKEAFD